MHSCRPHRWAASQWSRGSATGSRLKIFIIGHSYCLGVIWTDNFHSNRTTYTWPCICKSLEDEWISLLKLSSAPDMMITMRWNRMLEHSHAFAMGKFLCPESLHHSSLLYDSSSLITKWVLTIKHSIAFIISESDAALSSLASTQAGPNWTNNAFSFPLRVAALKCKDELQSHTRNNDLWRDSSELE